MLLSLEGWRTPSFQALSVCVVISTYAYLGTSEMLKSCLLFNMWRLSYVGENTSNLEGRILLFVTVLIRFRIASTNKLVTG